MLKKIDSDEIIVEKKKIDSDKTIVEKINTNSGEKKKRKRCQYNKCRDKVANIVGDCHYCDGYYCLEHRLPEDHVCCNLDKKKEYDLKKFEKKLLSEKCVNDKITRF